MGVATGAFHWSVSPWYVALKQALRGLARRSRRAVALEHAAALVDPDRLSRPFNDQMTFLDGAVLLAYIGATALVDRRRRSRSACGLPPAASGRRRARGFIISPRASSRSRAAACFSGSQRITVTMLRAEGFTLGFVGSLRALLLGGAVLWSIVLGWRIAGLVAAHPWRRFAATLSIALAASIGAASWVMLFWVWQ